MDKNYWNYDDFLGSRNFNDIENLLESIFDKILHWDMEAYDCCKDLLKETTKFNIILINVNKNIMKC